MTPATHRTRPMALPAAPRVRPAADGGFDAAVVARWWHVTLQLWLGAPPAHDAAGAATLAAPPHDPNEPTR